MEQFVDKTGC